MVDIIGGLLMSHEVKDTVARLVWYGMNFKLF